MEGPTASTLAAHVSATSAYLCGSANPTGKATEIFFEWGETRSYGNSTVLRKIGSGTDQASFIEPLPTLTPGTYHYRTVTLFPGGRAEGNDVVFSILAPWAKTEAASLGQGWIELKGSANAQGAPAVVYFEWGDSTNYGNITPSRALGGVTETQFSETLAGLPSGIYHYRAVLTNDTQAVFGSNQIVGTAGLAAKVSGDDYIRSMLLSDSILGNGMFPTEDFTFEFWFNASTPGVLLNEVDWSKPALWDYALVELFSDGGLKAAVPGVSAFNAGVVAFNEWRHFALVYDAGARILSAYLDGKPAGNSAGDRISPRDVRSASVYCFGRGGPTNLAGGAWLSGYFDEVRIWSIPLNASEIESRFNKVITWTDPDLVANWHFDMGSLIPSYPYLSSDASGRYNHAWHVPETELALSPSSAPVTVDHRPVIITNVARNITPLLIRVEAAVNPQGADTTVFFEYGRSNNFRRTLPRSIGSSFASVEFSEPLGNLVPGWYDYRLVASNSFGVTETSLASFQTAAGAGYAYRLGAGDFLRTISDQNSHFSGKDITIELWFHPGKAGVLAAETDFSAFDRAIIEILPSGKVQGAFNGLQPTDFGDAKFNAWNHVAIRYNASDQRMCGFLNGRQSRFVSGIRITAADLGFAGQFAFGRAASARLATGEYFVGDLDEIRIWRIARSNDDLSSAQHNLLAGDETGLVLNWRGNADASEPILDTGLFKNLGANVGAEVISSTAPLFFNVRRINSSVIETQFIVEPGSRFRVEQTSDFKTWTPIATNDATASGCVRQEQAVESATKMKVFRAVSQ